MTMESLDDQVLQEPAADIVQGGAAHTASLPGWTFAGYTYTSNGHAYPSYVED